MNLQKYREWEQTQKTITVGTKVTSNILQVWAKAYRKVKSSKSNGRNNCVCFMLFHSIRETKEDYVLFHNYSLCVGNQVTFVLFLVSLSFFLFLFLFFIPSSLLLLQLPNSSVSFLNVCVCLVFLSLLQVPLCYSKPPAPHLLPFWSSATDSFRDQQWQTRTNIRSCDFGWWFSRMKGIRTELLCAATK